MECMIASSLLAISAVGISGAMTASYGQDGFSKRRAEAVKASGALMNEMTSLPLDPGTSTAVGLSDFSSYSDTVNLDSGGSAVVAKAAAKQAAAGGSTTSTTGLLGAVVGVVNGILGGSSSGSSSSSSTSTATQSKATPSATASRTVQVDRRSTLNGSSTPTGDFAIVTVNVTTADKRTMKIKRLITSAEAAGNVTK